MVRESNQSGERTRLNCLNFQSKRGQLSSKEHGCKKNTKPHGKCSPHKEPHRPTFHKWKSQKGFRGKAGYLGGNEGTCLRGLTRTGRTGKGDWATGRRFYQKQAGRLPATQESWAGAQARFKRQNLSQSMVSEEWGNRFRGSCPL